MTLKSVILMCVCSLVFLVTNYAAHAAGTGAPYENGFVVFRLPLDYVLPEGLVAAAKLLRSGDTEHAEPLFRAEVQANPNDFPAWIGFIQSSKQDWPTLLPQYESDARSDPTAVNEFRLGLICWYMAVTDIQVGHHSPGPEAGLVGPSLRAAYALSLDPSVGFVYAGASMLLGCDDPQAIYESMLFHFSNEAGLFDSYRDAEINDWLNPLPAVAPMESDRMYLAGRIIRNLYSVHGLTGGGDKSTSEQMRAMEFLGKWGEEYILQSNLPTLQP